MRVNGQHLVSSWTQFESQLPKGKVEPACVKVEENDTKVEGFPVFEKLVELSWIGMTPDEVIAELGVEPMTTKTWEVKYWDSSTQQMLDWFGLSEKFLNRHYFHRWAYIKVGEKEIYGQVEIWSRRYNMKTSIGILTMPTIYIRDVLSDENKYVFFPLSALLSENEQGLFELYRSSWSNWEEIAETEREIMRQLEKLSVLKQQKTTIAESNWQLQEIEEMCKNSGTIKKLYCADWNLVLDFDRRMAIDSDNDCAPVVLPPVKIQINLRNFTVRWDRYRHPHILSDNTLCMGGSLTDLAHKCITNRDFKTLVGGMIDFWNSWTSSDAWDSDRAPADCIIRYYQDNPVERESLPVSKEDILRTIEYRGYSMDDLGQRFCALFNNWNE